MTLTRILFLFLLTPSFLFSQEIEKRRQMDSDTLDVKRAFYSYLGGIQQNDWEFILASSSERLRDQVNAGLVYSSGLEGNEKLDALVIKHLDGKEIPQLGNDSSKDEIVRALSGQIEEPAVFFVTGLKLAERPRSFFRLGNEELSIVNWNIRQDVSNVAVRFKSVAELKRGEAGEEKVVWEERQVVFSLTMRKGVLLVDSIE